MKLNKPLVSICCITYNHVNYIRDCIEGFLKQKTLFPVEIIIHDDASTDGTDRIIREYADKYPEFIITIIQKENQFSKGIKPIFEYVYPRAQGKYIANCEGDDYWTDSYKLQKQVDFLEKNPDYSMICTKYRKYSQKKQKYLRSNFNRRKYKKEIKFEDYILDMSSIATATVVFDKSILKNFEKGGMTTFVVGDTPLWLYIAATSKIAVLPEVTSTYRILNNSACHFSDYNKHYDFVKKGFSIAEYFLHKYAYDNKELEKGLIIRKLRHDLFYGYRSFNKEIAENAFMELSKFKLSFKYKISSIVYYFGSKTALLHKLTRYLFKLYLVI